MEKYIWFEKQKNYEMRIEKSISLKLRGKSKKIGESVEEEDSQKRTNRVGQMQLACVPMKIRERDGGARVCPGPKRSERASELFVARGN